MQCGGEPKAVTLWKRYRDERKCKLKPQYSIGGFEWIFYQSFKKCSILTPDIRIQPQTSLESGNLKCILQFNEIWPLEGAIYITLWYNFGGIPIFFLCVCVCAIFSEYWSFQTKRFTVLLELIQLFKENPLEKLFFFTIYQNYTLALR